MKLRIQGNAIRLRLSQSEVKDFSETGKVEDRTAFGPLANETLTYVLERAPVEHPSAVLANHQIKVTIPVEMGTYWANTDEVGIQYDLPLGDGNTLRILVEKDFKCLTERIGENESDNFPNPHVKC